MLKPADVLRLSRSSGGFSSESRAQRTPYVAVGTSPAYHISAILSQAHGWLAPTICYTLCAASAGAGIDLMPRQSEQSDSGENSLPGCLLLVFGLYFQLGRPPPLHNVMFHFRRTHRASRSRTTSGQALACTLRFRFGRRQFLVGHAHLKTGEAPRAASGYWPCRDHCVCSRIRLLPQLIDRPL